MGIRFLSLNDVLNIHQDTLHHEGGSPGIRDIALIESAVAMPMASFGGIFLHEDLAAMAAALMESLIGNHGIADGNKRVGTLAALVFLTSTGSKPTHRLRRWRGWPWTWFEALAAKPN